tara:strand:- start:91 stop:453 length:363 start_codon:yes stop_codon:yes gene_type:complete
MLAEAALSRIGNDPNRLSELTDAELQAVELAQEGAGCILAARLYQAVKCNRDICDTLLNSAVALSWRTLERRAFKAKTAIAEGRAPTPQSLAALIAFGRAEHTAIETEIARRDAQKATIQ